MQNLCGDALILKEKIKRNVQDVTAHSTVAVQNACAGVMSDHLCGWSDLSQECVHTVPCVLICEGLLLSG